MLCGQNKLCSISCELDSATLLAASDSAYDIHTLPQWTYGAELGTPRHGVERISGIAIGSWGLLGLVEDTAPRKLGHAVFGGSPARQPSLASCNRRAFACRLQTISCITSVSADAGNGKLCTPVREVITCNPAIHCDVFEAWLITVAPHSYPFAV